MTCDVKTNSISYLKNKGYIDENLFIKSPLFWGENRELSDLARSKYGITREGTLFTTKELSSGTIKAVPNEEFFSDLQKAFNETNPSLQLDTLVASTASTEILAKVKEAAAKMGISLKDLAEYAQKTGLDIKGVNGVADLTAGVIALAEGKEDSALTEETVHIATAILEQTNPKMITEMISKINRFKIYNQVLEAYKGNKYYQLPSGKTDIRKIKKEAVDKLITEIIVNGNTEGMEEEDISWIQKIWRNVLDFIGGIYRKSGITIFEKAAAQILSGEVGTIQDMTRSGIFLQTDSQTNLREKLSATSETIQKVQDPSEKVDPLLNDSEDASNYYRVKQPDGSWVKLSDIGGSRVTDRVKNWYKANIRRFSKPFTKEQEILNEVKRQWGVKGHLDLQEILQRWYNEDGTRRPVPLERTSRFHVETQEMYDQLENYAAELVGREGVKGVIPEGSLVFVEKIIYDPKKKEAGTIDFLAIEPSGKAHIMDWKFIGFSPNAEDVPWFKLGAYNIQLGRYKEILRDFYGVKEFGMIRAVPFAMRFRLKVPGKKDSGLILDGLGVGTADATKIGDLKLVPVSEQTESTGYPKLDKILKDLNALHSQIKNEKFTDEEERIFKRTRLNTIMRAIRIVQGTHNVAPLIDVITVMAEEGQRIINDYEAFYKDKKADDPDLSNAALSDFSEDMDNYVNTSELFINIARDLRSLLDKPELAKTPEGESLSDILKEMSDASDKIYEARSEILKIRPKFGDKFIGVRNLVTGLLEPEKVLKGLGSWFRGVSDLPNRSLKILTKLTTLAQGEANRESVEEAQEVVSIMDKLKKRGGNLRSLVEKIYQKDDKDKIVNRLIHQFDREFYKKVDDMVEGVGDKKWILDNIDVEAYKKEAAEVMKTRIERAENDPRYKGSETKELEREKYILKVQQEFDIDREDFYGWNNYIIKRHPLPKWHSQEYKVIEKDADLLELYNFIRKINAKAKEIGYIDNRVASVFLPWVRKSTAEQLAWNDKLTPIKNFNDNLRLAADTVGYGKINALTNELEHSIPKYYSHEFTDDPSEVSMDLFKNMILYIKEVNKYKYLSEVEGQLKLVRTLEEFKAQHLSTSRSNSIISKDGKPEVVEGNQENLKMYDEFMKVLLYGQKYVLSDADTPLPIAKVMNFFKSAVNKVAGREILKKDENPTPTSMLKTVDALNRGFQLKTLGINLTSGMINWFGGNIQMITQSGKYFTKSEFLANEGKLLGKGSFFRDEEILSKLIDAFMPLREDPALELYKKAGMSPLTNSNLSDKLMVFFRKPEQLVEKAAFLSLLDNMMIENGKIVSIRDWVSKKYSDRYSSSQRFKETKVKISAEIAELKRTRSISAIKKLEDGKLVIPGLDLSNRSELQRVTEIARRISRDATGGMTDSNINRMSMNIWTKSMMLFKNWIPKLTDTRFSELKKVSDDFSVTIDENGNPIGEQYDIGRIRLLAHVLLSKFSDSKKSLTDILAMNDAGIQQLDALYQEYAEKFEKDTGQVFTMSREDFIDMVRNNLSNQLQELAILASLLGIMISMGVIGPGDDTDKAVKNRYRYVQKTIGNFVQELSFFYNPFNYEALLHGSLFPALGLVTDMEKFLSHFFMEITGINPFRPLEEADEVRKKAMPLKYGMKAAPVTKEILTYLSIFDSDFAKDYKITIQAENNRSK